MRSLSIFILGVLAIFATGCQNKAAQDNTVEAESTAMTVDYLIDNAASLTDSLITIEGVCTHTCKHGATKMFLIGTDDSKTIRVEACELGSFKPEVVNSLVTVKGNLREQRIDEKYLADWEERIKANEETQHGETGAGCDSERAARGVESVSAKDQIDEYRQRIADKVANGGDPWLSYYYVEAKEYEINE